MLCWCLPLVVFHIPLATWIVQLSTSVPTDLLEDPTFGRRCEHHQWSPPKPRPEYRHSCPSRNHTPCCKWVWNYQQWYSKRKISTWDTMNISPILGIGFLQQSRPELIWVFGVNKDESPIDCWKLIINDNIHPFSKSPKLWWRERREYGWNKMWFLPFTPWTVGNDCQVTLKWKIPQYSSSNSCARGTTCSKMKLWNVSAPMDARNQQFPE